MKTYVDIPVADKEKTIDRLRLITQKNPPKVTWVDGVCPPLDPNVVFHGWISDRYMCITPIFTGFKNFSAPMYGEFIEQDGQCVLRIKKPIEQYVIKYGLLGIVVFYFLLPGLLFTEGTSLSDIWSLLFPVVWLMIAWTCMRYNEKKFFYRPLERIRGLCEQN